MSTTVGKILTCYLIQSINLDEKKDKSFTLPPLMAEA